MERAEDGPRADDLPADEVGGLPASVAPGEPDAARSAPSGEEVPEASGEAGAGTAGAGATEFGATGSGVAGSGSSGSAATDVRALHDMDVANDWHDA